MLETEEKIQLNIDGAFCISIKERSDKRALLENQWTKLDFKPEYILVDKDEENPERGCFNSHQACMREALARGYNRVLIFEDDVTVNSTPASQIKNINSFLDRNNPDIFYLGVILGKTWLTWNKNITRCRGMGTHAYIISSDGCKEFLSRDFDNIAIDRRFRKVFPKRYSTFPMICHQLPIETTQSDIALHRGAIGMNMDFWNAQSKKERLQIIVNFYKTLLHIF